MLCTGTIDEVDQIVQFCLNDLVLSKILHEGFYEELLSEELLGPLEHYDRILYYLIEISRIGYRYQNIPYNFIVYSIDQLDEIIDIFYLMDIGRKDIVIGWRREYPFFDYLYIPTFLRNARSLGVWVPSELEHPLEF